MSRLRVAVVRGGVGSEYHESLDTGGAVLYHLDRNRYEPYDVVITRDGSWTMNGFPFKQERLPHTVDIVFNALHGRFGEDGKFQQQLDLYRVPYTGSRVLPSALAMNKGLAKHSFEFVGLKTPRSITVRVGDDVASRVFEIVRQVRGPFVVKPVASGSSVGVGLVRTFDELLLATRAILENNDAVLVEEYIEGREVTVGVVDSSEQNRPYALSPVLVVLAPGERLWGHSAKRRGRAKLVAPAPLEPEHVARAQAVALATHEALGLRHYSRTDMIITPTGVYVMEVNSLPGLGDDTPYARSLASAGLDMADFLDHVITLAHSRR